MKKHLNFTNNIKSEQCNALLWKAIDSAVITQRPTVNRHRGFAKITRRCSILRATVDGLWYAAFELVLSSPTIVSLCRNHCWISSLDMDQNISNQNLKK